MPKKQDQQIKKRPRPYQPSHCWTQVETNSMMKLVVTALKDNPENYEKPTAQRFFQKLAEISPKLASIDWICMKSKMRFMDHVHCLDILKPYPGNTISQLVYKSEVHHDCLLRPPIRVINSRLT